MTAPDPLAAFAPATREWFTQSFSGSTPAQAGAWSAIAEGGHVLVVAPTGSGKTLAAFLAAIDRLTTEVRSPDREPGTRVLYVSPLKALAVDVDRNLRSPLVGIDRAAARRGEAFQPVTVGIRTGDTPQAERRRMASNPPDVLITTPESLFLMLTSSARQSLSTVDVVIVDEIHAVAGTKRGAHLAVSLERLDDLLGRPAQRIGLSATARPVDEVARFLGGHRPVHVVAPASPSHLDLSVVVPVDDMTALPASTPPGLREGSAARSLDEPDAFASDEPAAASGSIWPHVEESILDQVLSRRSTIVFVNSRGLAERLTARLNELHASRLDGASEPPAMTRRPAQMSGASGETTGAGQVAPGGGGGGAGDGGAVEPGGGAGDGGAVEPGGGAGGGGSVDIELARAHHGSVSKEQRALIEDDLKTGRLRCVVATSSLELGIDMGAVDLVIQVSSPPSVASGLQRVGRAGHQVGETSIGVIYPKTRQDLLSAAVTAERMRAGLLEPLRVPANPLDILAQQTVAACALDSLDVDDWFDTVRRAAPFAGLPRSVYEATLDLVAGRYPSEEFAELRPRIVWDRAAGTLTGRPGAQRLAVTSGGTIPDRGQFAVTLPEGSDDVAGSGSRRVGELDEEMVYESRINDVVALGATSWRIQDITHDRVVVVPAPGQPGRLPFWKGETEGRPVELGAAIGAFVRELSASTQAEARQRGEQAGLDVRAVDNLVAFLDDQRKATGRVPTDRTLVVERFRDELGDWRVILHSPFGRRVHAPWALAVGARIQDRFGIDGSVVASDDGIVARLPDTEAEPPGADLFVFDADELDQLVTEEVGGSALFAARFRECAARALLLPRRNPGRRSPLWQQRQRSSQLLEVARSYPTFPILLETARECLQDVYDLPALAELAQGIASREIDVVEVTTDKASPFAHTMLFGYVATFLYEGDTPLAERRASALALDSSLLSELLGKADLRELLDPAAVDLTEAELQRLTDDRKVTGLEGVADLLRLLGPLSTDEVAARTTDAGHVPEHLDELLAGRRALRLTIAGEQRWSVVEDAARLRDALGTALPVGVPEAFLETVADPLGDVLGRYARTHGPFSATEVATRFGLGIAVVTDALRRLAQSGRLTEGEFRPHGAGAEWVSPEVLRRLRSRSLAAARQQVEPVDTATYARFLSSWQHLAGRPGGGQHGELRGVDGVLTVVEQLAGVSLPASAWESLVLPARVRDYSPTMLDELTAGGEVVWQGDGSLPGHDGWVRLMPADLVQTPAASDLGAQERALLDALSDGGAYFFRQLSDAVGSTDDAALADALWQLVWAGHVSNDTLAPLRTLVGSTGAHRLAPRPPRARSARRPSRAPRVARTGPPTVSGRWYVPDVHDLGTTEAAVARAETLLSRYGVVTRGSVTSEQVPGGFAGVYRVLRELEQSGGALRGYVVEGLGAAQFAAAATIDRVRSFTLDDDAPTTALALVLAATDPANPYGAALAWPDRGAGDDSSGTSTSKHRPGRKAGALVALHDGHLVAYLERGGRTALTFSQSPERLAAVAAALAATVRTRRVERLAIESVDGRPTLSTPFGDALVEAGFDRVPKGVRLRA